MFCVIDKSIVLLDNGKHTSCCT